MRILGIDFTSTPGRLKPITCLNCTFDERVLRTGALEEWWDFSSFEEMMLCLARSRGRAWQNRAKGYGAKSPVDPVEGWIADPSLLQSRDEDRHLQYQQCQQAAGQSRGLAAPGPARHCLSPRAQGDRFPEFPIAAIEKGGYDAVWRGEKSWNGVAILGRGGEPVLTRTGLPGDLADTLA